MLLGREAEQSLIAEMLGRAAGGESAALLVRGEPGIGKSALLEATRVEARRRGMTVLFTRGRETDAEVAFSGLLTLVRPVLDRCERLDEGHAEVLSGALTGMGDGSSVGPASVRQALLALVGLLTKDGPVVVLVDDVHWLDRGSLDPLLFVLRRLDADPVAAVLTTRPSVGGEAEESGFEAITLRGLDPESLHEVVSGRTPIDATVLKELTHLTLGNPLATRELAAGLDEETRLGRRPLPPLPTPGQTITRAFAGRLARLPESVQRCAVVAAADHTGQVSIVLAALEALGEPRGAVEELETASVLEVTGPTLRFQHPLLRLVAYHLVAPPSRRAAHRALASALGAPEHAEARAWQLAAAVVGEDEGAAHALELVASAARARGASASAATTLHRAADLSPSVADRTRRLLDACRSWLAAGDVERAGVCADDARRIAPLGMAAAAAAIVGALPDRWRLGPRAAAARALAVAKPRDGIDDAPAALLAVAADESRLAAVTVRAAPWRGEVPDGLGDAAVAVLDERARLRDARAHVDAGAFSAALDRLAPLLDPGQAALLTLDAAALMADVRRQTGAFALGLEELVGAIEAANVRSAPQSLDAEIAMAHLEGVLGRSNDCRARLDAAEGVASRLGFGLASSRIAVIRGELALAAGDYATAVSHLESAGRHDAAEQPWMPDLVEALVRAGRGSEVDQLDADPDGMGVLARLRRRRARALADAHPPESFTAIADELSAAGAPFEAARTTLVAAEEAHRLRDAGAPRLAGSAAESFMSLGAALWAERARAAGGLQTNDRPPELSSLTKAEFRVALTVGRGCSNREAADALFLSIKTVDCHLQRIYRKLEVRSRSELTAVVTRVVGDEGTAP